jgi:hypothetical protein
MILSSPELTALNSDKVKRIDSEFKVLFIRQMITKEPIRHKETSFPHWDGNVLFKVARLNDDKKEYSTIRNVIHKANFRPNGY